MNFRVERQCESLHENTPKKSFSSVCFALQKGFSASLFATWSGRCHCDPSSILCYLCVGRVNNMEKLLCHLKSPKDESCTVQTVSPFFFFFKYVFKKACFLPRTRMHNNLGELKLLFFTFPYLRQPDSFGGEQKVKGICENKCYGVS